MPEKEPNIQLSRTHVVIALSVPVAFVCYYAFLAIRAVPRLQLMFEDLGQAGRLPGITQVMIVTHRLWVVIALVFVGLVAHVWFRTRLSAKHCIVLFVASCVCAMAFHAVLVEGVFAPLFQLMTSIGAEQV